jgi:TRPM family ion channel
MGGRDSGDWPVLVRVERVPEIAAALDSASIRRDRPVVVLVGGAGGVDDSYMRPLEVVLRDVVVPVVTEHAAVVVDGGTDFGVMRAIGRVRSATGGGFVLVGVAARGTVVESASASAIKGAARLEAHHTHVVLVPGTSWGDESPWLDQVADVVAGSAPSVTVLFNGGEISYDDVSRSLDNGRPVVVLAGTGRTADAIAAAAAGCEGDPRARRIAGSELIRVVPIEDVAAVRAALGGALSAPRRSR